MQLKEYKLSQLLEIKNGKDHQNLSDGQYPVYGSGGIMRYVNCYLYDKPSILLPRKGSLSNIQFCDVPFWTVDTTYYTVVNDTLANPYYLYRYLSLLDLSQLDSGTGVPSMTFDSYYNTKVKLPDIATQRRFAAILQDIDNKIALNRAINQNLEALAKQLYDYWFVQFDFPNEEGKPYKSSGGKMVWNEELKREIPDGWEVTNIGTILDKVISTPRLSTDDYLSNGAFPIIDQTTDIYYAGFTNNKDAVVNQFPAVVFGDHSCAVKFVNFPFVRGADGTQVMLSKNANISIEYLYFVVKGIKIGKGYARHYSFLKEQPIIVPAQKEAKTFKDMAQVIFEQIIRNRIEIISLTKQRDELLPLLMNGQVSLLNCD